eukprot:3646154-Amphidinium_carterae.1
MALVAHKSFLWPHKTRPLLGSRFEFGMIKTIQSRRTTSFCTYVWHERTAKYIFVPCTSLTQLWLTTSQAALAFLECELLSLSLGFQHPRTYGATNTALKCVAKVVPHVLMPYAIKSVATTCERWGWAAKKKSKATAPDH